jgi:hypothetical protein
VTRRAQPEAALQRAVFAHVGWRAVPNVFAFHPANGGWRSPIEAKILKAAGVVPGVPDLILLHWGRCFGLELKTEHGRLTPIQNTTHDAMRAAGAIIATAYGIDQAIEQLTEWKLLRN